MGRIVNVCISEKKGTQKHPIDEGEFIVEFGLKGDAHAGLENELEKDELKEKVEEFNARGAGVKPGAFGENLLVEGWDLKTIPVGTKFRCNDVLLEITQIGKECHHGCEIFQKMGDCIMPRNGIFARVLEGGKIKPGDQIEIVE